MITVFLFTSQLDYTPAHSLSAMPQFLIIIDKVLTTLSFAFCHFWPYTNIQTQ